jgi:ribosomal protein L30E
MGGKGSGGKREGAGRKTEAPTVIISVRATRHERETLRRRAKLAGVSVTEYWKVKCLGGQDETETVRLDS